MPQHRRRQTDRPMGSHGGRATHRPQEQMGGFDASWGEQGHLRSGQGRPQPQAPVDSVYRNRNVEVPERVVGFGPLKPKSSRR